MARLAAEAAQSLFVAHRTAAGGRPWLWTGDFNEDSQPAFSAAVAAGFQGALAPPCSDLPSRWSSPRARTYLIYTNQLNLCEPVENLAHMVSDHIPKQLTLHHRWNHDKQRGILQLDEGGAEQVLSEMQEQLKHKGYFGTLDLSQAFDRVDPVIAGHCMKTLGLHPLTFQWTHQKRWMSWSQYFGRDQVLTSKSIPQGDPCSHELFDVPGLHLFGHLPSIGEPQPFHLDGRSKLRDQFGLHQPH